MGYQWSFGFLWHYERLFVRGIEITLAYTFGTILLGLMLGLLIGLARLSRSWLVNAPLVALIEMFRCTPLLVQIVWFYYALPVIMGVQIPATVAATAVLSLYTAAFYAEIFRGGIVSIERGQWDAARALGLQRWPMMRLVVLPQAVRRMVPPFMNQSIIQLKNTSLVSTIAVPDLLYQGQLITADTYRPLEVYTMVAMIYFCPVVPDDGARAGVRTAPGKTVGRMSPAQPGVIRHQETPRPAGLAASAARSSAVGNCGLSRSRFTMQRKPERLAFGRAELVPRPGRNRDQVARLHLAHLIAEQAVAVPPQDHHRVHVLVPLQRRIAAGCHFEIAQLTAEIGFREQHLARDRLERRAAFLLVGMQRDAVPAKIVAGGAEGAVVFDVHVRLTDKRARRRCA